MSRPYNWLAHIYLLLIIMKQTKNLFPKTKIKNIKENIHGTIVPDFYRWLENSNSQEVKKWSKEQNQYTQSVLNKIPIRNTLKKELKKYLAIDSMGVPVPKKERYFFTEQKGLQNQPTFYIQEKVDGKKRELVDVNKLSRNGNVALDWWYPSTDGVFVAYGISNNGDEKSTLFIKNAVTGKTLSDKIPHTEFCDIAWLPDNAGFYYTRKPAYDDVSKGEEGYHQRIYFHKIGANYKDDPIIFGEGRAKEDSFGVDLSTDGRFLFVAVHQGWSKNEIYLLDRQKNKWITVIKGIKATFRAVVHRGNIYILTNYKSPNFRICVIPIDRAGEGLATWRTIIEEGEYPIKDFKFISDKIFILTTKNVASKLDVFRLNGKFLREIKIPPFSVIDYLTAESEGDELFFDLQSFFIPRIIYRINVLNLSVSVWNKVDSIINVDNYNVRQILYESKDETKVPMFVVCRNEVICNGKNPTLLTGYGGFSVSFEPYFMPGIIPFLDRGGVYVVANIRGGNEFGEAWHKSGMLFKKQNSFDDFIAAAEYLIENKYTNSRKLAIEGASNGGLLIASVLSQRPDLFHAAVAEAPLFDMIRYEKSLIGKLWVSEYGSIENKKQFKYLYNYSPYHNLRGGVAYPAILIIAGKQDARVDPFHSRKMCASFQRATVSILPVLLRMESQSGHGAGKALSKIIDEYMDIWSFVFWQLGLLDDSLKAILRNTGRSKKK